MSRRKVRGVMTTEVLAIAVDTPVSELTAIAAATGFRTLPVLDGAGRLAGVVSAADVLPPAEPRAGRAGSRFLGRVRRVSSPRPTAAAAARDVMRFPVVTTSPEAPVAEAARSMSRHRLGELPVADACGHLVGIVSWADLGHVFLRSDAELAHEILRDVFVRQIGTDPALVQVSVADGLVTLGGVVARRSMIPLAAGMARAVDGVVDVISQLGYQLDDTVTTGGTPSPVPDLSDV